MIIEPLEGKVLPADSVPVNGYDALRIVVEHPLQGSESISIFIHKVGEILQVSFTTPASGFPEYEDALLDSIASITVE